MEPPPLSGAKGRPRVDIDRQRAQRCRFGQLLAPSLCKEKHMKAVIYALAVGLVAGSTASAAPLKSSAAERVTEAATTLREIHAVPDKDIPQELWEKAACVIVIPSLKKAAFIVGGEYGKGLMS